MTKKLLLGMLLRPNLRSTATHQYAHISHSTGILTEAFAEISEDGEIISVTLLLKGDESKAVLFITEQLGVKRERIKIKYDKD